MTFSHETPRRTLSCFMQRTPLVASAVTILMTMPLLASPQTTPAASSTFTPDEQAVLAPLQGVLDGIAKRDQALIREQLLPGGMATLIRNGQAVQLHFDAFVAHVRPGAEKLEERIHDPLIRIDNDLAIIWAPYDFLIDGKVDHCGTDIANLVRRDNRWLISGIADNTHSSCPAGK